MLFQIFFAFLGSLCFSVVFNIDKKELLLCGLAGAVSWLIYLLCTLYIGLGAVTSVFLSSIFVTSISRLLANFRKNPITIFLIPGIIPLVPGAGIYYTMYNIVISNNTQAALMGIETLKTAGAIAIGIIAVLSLPRRFFNLSK